MQLLLEPNIAYLFLLAGFVMAMLALATPGTGFFEVGALFCIALAGYAIYNLSVNWWALVIMASSLVPFVYALQKPKRELYLLIAIFLLVIGSVFIFPRTAGQPAINPIVAIAASVLVTGFLWLAVRKSLEAAHAGPSHNLEGLVGQVGEAKTKVYEEGSVQVAGELWSARSENSIPAGSAIRVIGREGFVLIVEKNH